MKISKNFISLLKNEKTEIKEVLVHSDLEIVLKGQSALFCDFVNKPDNLNTLFDFIFTNKYVKDENYNVLERSGLSILACKPPNYIEAFAKNDIFKKRLNQFMISKTIEQAHIIHFCIVVSNIAKETKGEYLKSFLNMWKFLISNLKFLCVRDLLVELISQFPKEFNVKQEMFVAIADNSTIYFSASVIFQCLNKNETLYDHFKTNAIVESLLKTVLKTKDVLAINEIFRTIVAIEKKHQHDSIISNYAKLYHFPNDCTLFEAIKVFKILTPTVLLQLFSEKQNSLLNESIYQTFKAIPKRIQIDLIQKTDLYTKIMSNFKKNKMNGQIAKLTEYLNSEKDLKAPDSWKSFYENEVAKHLSTGEGAYGGEILPDEEEEEEEEEEAQDDDNDDIY